ncbi:MAG: hypothetical protein ACI4XI_08280 [Ruminococcus sp.]
MKITINALNKKYFWIFITSLLTSFLLISICSKSSFLYPLNDWVDANCFFTVGKSMTSGMVVYRDIFEQKGLLLYVIHALAYLISNDTFFGVFVFEVISATAVMIFAFKILFLYDCKKSAFIFAPLFSAVIYSSHAFCQGDSAEEFCLPFLMCGLYLSLKSLKQKKAFSVKQLFCIGIISGCVLWIKYTMLGFFIGFVIVPLIMILRNREWKYLLKCVGFVVLGVAAVSLPVLIYFAVNGAMQDLFRVYFYDNMFLYSDGSQGESFLAKIYGVFLNTAKGVFYAVKKNILPAILVLCGFIYELLKDGRKMLANYLVLTVFTALFIFGGGRHYDYYALPLCIFSLHGFIFATQKAETFLNKKRKGAFIISAVFSLILSTSLSLLICPNVKSMLVPKEELAQYKFKNIINETQNPTLLNYGTLDNGFYTVCNIVPNCKYFCNLNLPLDDIKIAQDEYVSSGRTDYVVARGKKYQFENYSLVSSATSDYKGGKRTYYLYKKE